MLKTPLKFIRKLESDWSKSEVNNNYPFIDDMNDMIRALYTSIEKMNISSNKNLKVVKNNTIVNTHALLSETLFSVLSELRIVLNPLNRSMIENYILLSFVIKYGEECAKLFVANSEFVYYKTMLKHEKELTEVEIVNFKEAMMRFKISYPTVKFADQHKWANQFMNKPRNINAGLKELASDIGIDSVYSMLTNFHHQTHSSSAFAHYMNTVEFTDYDMYIMKAVMVFNYGYEICRLVFDENEIKDIKLYYDSLMKKYRSIYNK